MYLRAEAWPGLFHKRQIHFLEGILDVGSGGGKIPYHKKARTPIEVRPICPPQFFFYQGHKKHVI